VKPKLLDLWRTFVLRVANLSTCDRLNVGCLLLSPDGERLLAFGYNGTWRGGSNEVEEDVEGHPGWVHAEQNALVKSRSFEPFVALTSHTPCYTCAMLLINAQVEKVYSVWRYRDEAGWSLLKEAGVPVHLLDCHHPYRYETGRYSYCRDCLTVL